MTVTYNAKVYYSGDGVTTIFALPFPYISALHLHAYVGGVATGSWSLSTPTTLQFTTAPAAGTLNIELRRETPNDAALHTIQTGTILPADINMDVLQLLYIEQELEDSLHGPFDLDGHLISNVGDAVGGKDAANRDVVNTLILAAINQGTANPTGAVLASYAVGRALTAGQLTNDTIVYFKGRTSTADGGQGFFKLTNANPGYADDDGVVLKVTGLNFWFVRVLTDHIYLNWYAVYASGGGDTGPSLRAAIAAATFFNISTIKFFGALGFTTQICNATFGWTLPSGLKIEGVGLNSSLTGSGVHKSQWIYSGTSGTYMFDVRNADGLGTGVSNITFENFEVATATNNGFVAVNQLRQNGAAYTCGVGTFPLFSQGWRFINIKGSGHFTNSFLKAKMLFELYMDPLCEIINFFYGLDLVGCDDATVCGRYEGNAARHISHRKEGTFGNSAMLQPNFLGAHLGADATENHYAIYDTGESTTMMSLYVELDGANARACLYLEGTATNIFRPKMYSTSSAVPYFELGSTAVNVQMYGPEAPTGTSVAAPIIQAVSAGGFNYTGGGYDNYNITVFNPSTTITARLQNAQRVQIVNGSTKVLGRAMSATPSFGLSVNGPKIRNLLITPQNPGPITAITSGPQGTQQDTANYNFAEQAITMPGNADGFYVRYTVGRDISNGDTVTYKVLGRCSVVPGAGNLSTFMRKNGVTLGSPSAVTTASNAYNLLTASLTLAGYATGDTLDFVVLNNGLTGAVGLVGAMEIENKS